MSGCVAGGRTVRRVNVGHLEGSRRARSRLDGRYSTATAMY